MGNNTGKLFRNTVSREIAAFPYDFSKNYYALIQEAQKKGYEQCIITSDIMIELMEYFLMKQSTINSIEFFVEDTELESEINTIIRKIKTNGIYWESLKNKLIFLSTENSIEIKAVTIKSLEYIIKIAVNGIFTVTSSFYGIISNELASFIGERTK